VRWHHSEWKAADLLHNHSPADLYHIIPNPGVYMEFFISRDDIILGGRQQIFCTITLLLLTSHFQYFHCCCCCCCYTCCCVEILLLWQDYQAVYPKQLQKTSCWCIGQWCAVVFLPTSPHEETTSLRPPPTAAAVIPSAAAAAAAFVPFYCFCKRRGQLQNQNGVQHKQGLWQCGDYNAWIKDD